MRIFSILFVVAVAVPPILSAGQSSSAPAAGQSSAGATTTPAGTPAPNVPAPSSLLQPSLDAVEQALTAVKVDKWKRGSVRDEATEDIGSIVSDMQLHVPPLMKDADAAPGSLSKTLPLSRHVDALYDVLLRVVEAARIAAPDEQANQLRQALSQLGKARLALDDSLEQVAGSQEKQMAELRITVAKQASFKCPAPPPAPECPKPAAKKTVKRKPKPPAAAAPGTTPTPGTQQKPSPAQPKS